METELLEGIKREVDERRITQAELARTLGISRQAVNQYLKGQLSPFPEVISSLLEYLGLEVVVKPRENKNEQE